MSLKIRKVDRALRCGDRNLWIYTSESDKNICNPYMPNISIFFSAAVWKGSTGWEWNTQSSIKMSANERYYIHFENLLILFFIMSQIFRHLRQSSAINNFSLSSHKLVIYRMKKSNQLIITNIPQQTINNITNYTASNAS